MNFYSPDFENNGNLPVKFTCDGEKAIPVLKWGNLPPQTQSLALIVDDPDAPNGVYTHWLTWNIDPKIEKLAQNNLPSSLVYGQNSSGKTAWVPPCPPDGVHRYFFHLYALKNKLNLTSGASRAELEKNLQPLLLASAQLMAKYSRESAIIKK